jgi:hypothetical protein
MVALIVLVSTPAAHAYLQLPGSEFTLRVDAIPGNIEVTGDLAGFLISNGFPGGPILRAGPPTGFTDGHDIGVATMGWCADRHTTTTTGTLYTAHLYSSYDPNLPACAKNGKDWNRINYVVNVEGYHFRYDGRFPTIMELQDTVWYFSENMTGKPLPASAIVGALVREAIDKGGGYHPADERQEAIVAFVSCTVQTIFFQLYGGVTAIPPTVPPPTVPPPTISVPSVPAPTVSSPTPIPVAPPSIPVPVAAGAAAGVAALSAGVALDTGKREQEKEPEEEEPQKEPIPVPAE